MLRPNPNPNPNPNPIPNPDPDPNPDPNPNPDPEQVMLRTASNAAKMRLETTKKKRRALCRKLEEGSG